MISFARAFWYRHRDLFLGACSEAWSRRRRLAVLSVAIWVPWRILVPFADDLLGFRSRAGIPLEWLADAFVEPLYGGVGFLVLADAFATSDSRLLTSAARLYPRVLLIDLKVALMGIAAPYLVLHLGSASLLTIWPTWGSARFVMIATLLSAGWIFVVMVRYMLATAVLVAEWRAPGGSEVGAGSVSSGWAMWASRRLLRGRVVDALAVIVVGQVVVGSLTGLVPEGEGTLYRAADGLTMVVTAFWWSLLWRFMRLCIDSPAARVNGRST